MSEENEKLRDVPNSELDLQLMLTNTKWGDSGIPKELLQILGKSQVVTLDGRNYVDVSSLWGLMGYYTRDLRLGNISYYGGEVDYCQQYIDFAGDCLRGISTFKRGGERRTVPLVNSFMCCLSRAVTLLEVSQSRGGFLRKRQGTLTSENVQSTLEPQKKGLFNKGEKD